ncbi:hypothetical protein AB0B45_50740 [Nonomuraea sp. NPDC049152]|uniref:hypothetical protein n=1 Tax=Nonomuraea sp. NPDC049152 TaxID=3154350 RepID=UPI0033ED798F
MLTALLGLVTQRARARRAQQALDAAEQLTELKTTVTEAHADAREARQELTAERRRSDGDLELLRDQLAQQLSEPYRKPASAMALAPGCAGGRRAG